MSKWAGIEYTEQRDSIEWVYLGLARYLKEAGLRAIGGDAQWFPYWYNGIPVDHTYPPLLHYLTALFMKLGRTSSGHGYHASTAFLYCLGGAGVFALARRWTGSIWASVCGACAYSLLSPCSWLMPSIAGDLHGYWMNQRLSVLARYGEGPHVAALALLPFALLAVDRFAERRDWRRGALAALACAMVPLANIIGGFALAWGVLGIALARGWRSWLALLGMGMWAYVLALRWLTPWFLADIRRNAPFVGGPFPMDAKRYAALAGLAVVTAAAVYWLKRWPRGERLAPIVGFTLPMAVIPLTWEFAEFYFLPQPHRYHLEMDMGLALLSAWGIAQIPARSGRWVSLSALVACLGFAAVQGRALDSWIHSVVLRDTWEYRIVRAMANHDPEARVYFQGTPRFFAGLERNQMQFGGGFSNGLRLPTFFLLDYGVGAGEDNGVDTLVWLKALGVDYVAVGDTNTQNLYQNWKKPGKFDAHAPTVWQEGGDRILEVRRANESLAHIIPAGAVMRHSPVGFYDMAEVRRYVEALEGPESNGGVLRWLNPSTAMIEGEIRNGDRISVQVAYDPRWKATTAEGRQLRIEADGMGQMEVIPSGVGTMKMQLEFRNPPLLFVIWGVGWLIFLGAVSQFRIPFARS